MPLLNFHVKDKTGLTNTYTLHLQWHVIAKLPCAIKFYGNIYLAHAEMLNFRKASHVNYCR